MVFVRESRLPERQSIRPCIPAGRRSWKPAGALFDLSGDVEREDLSSLGHLQLWGSRKNPISWCYFFASLGREDSGPREPEEFISPRTLRHSLRESARPPGIRRPSPARSCYRR